MNTKIKGTLWGCIAAATYGMNPLFTLPLYHRGMNADSVLFYRYALAIVMLGIMMKIQGQTFSLKRNELLPLFLAGMLFGTSSLFLFLSYQHMDAGIASTLLFVYPVMVAVIMALFFHEKITLLTLGCIFLALGGIALLHKGGDGVPLSPLGFLFVMLSALSYAIYIAGVNFSSLKELPGAKLTFYMLVSGLFIFAVRLDFGMGIPLPRTLPLWGNLLALAFLTTVVSMLATTFSVRYIGATPTAILGALEPVTAIFFGVMVFGERLTPRLICGVLLILVSVTLIVTGKNFIRRLYDSVPGVLSRTSALFQWTKRD